MIGLLVSLPVLAGLASVIAGAASGAAWRDLLTGGLLAVLLAHLLFVLPYAVFALAGPWAALPGQYRRGAASLGAGEWTILRRIVLPLLRLPLGAAGAIGFAVSCSLYLPTLFAGEGRVATLASEAVALAGGADRRITAVLALSQAALPMAGFALLRLIRRRG